MSFDSLFDTQPVPGQAAPFSLDIAGIAAGARYVASPNCDARPDDAGIELIVIHNISLPPNEFGSSDVERLFTNCLDPEAHPYFGPIAALRVSAHFLIRRTGECVQFVPCELKAWHAGQSSWCGRERCNDFSIGIELEGSDTQAFEPPQYATLYALINALRAHYGPLPLTGHSDIAPGRKTDPGPFFDWAQLPKL